MNALKQIRQRMGRDAVGLAAAIDITLPAYFDLETADDLHDAISIRKLAILGRELGVRPSAFFGPPSKGFVAPSDVVKRIVARTGGVSTAIASFEDGIGWSIGNVLETPDALGEFNVAGLRDLASALDLDWLEVLDGLGLDAGL